MLSVANYLPELEAAMYEVTEPFSNAEIVRELKKLHAASTDYWNSLPIDAFLASIGEAWSPADNVRHLVKSTRPIVKALKLPRILPAFLFGRADRPSRSYSELRDTYLKVLAAGGKAGRFAPSPQDRPSDPRAWRAALMAEREGVEADLEKAILKWDEAALDRYRLPHPLLGKLTVREMLFFTLYHNLHHFKNTASRLEHLK